MMPNSDATTEHNDHSGDTLTNTDWLYRCALRYHERWGYPPIEASKLATILLTERGGRLSATPEEDVDHDMERSGSWLPKS